MKGSGPGGQNRNKRATGVRLTHLPTGISARSDDLNSQAQNLKSAFSKLADQLVPLMKGLVRKDEIRKRFQSTERVRTYSEHDQRVTDDRLNEQYRYDDVMFGKGLYKIITDLLRSRNTTE